MFAHLIDTIGLKTLHFLILHYQIHLMDSISNPTTTTPDPPESLDVNCCICRDLLVIPVRPICFSCTMTDRWSQKSCYTYLRICMRCADEYFQLHKPPTQRKKSIRCLTCAETMNPTKMHRNNIYEVDFLFMKCMPTRVVDCPFCNQWTGDLQNDLYRHIVHECPSFSWECVCGAIYTQPTRQDHIDRCSRYSTCRECRQRVLASGLTRHMLHDHRFSLCCSCRAYVPLEEMSEHILHRCDERLVCCDICMGLIRMRLFQVHLRTHYHEITTRIHTLNVSLETEKERLTTVLDMFQENGISLHDVHQNDPYTSQTSLS